MSTQGAVTWFLFWALVTAFAFWGRRFSLRLLLGWVVASAVLLHLALLEDGVGTALRVAGACAVAGVGLWICAGHMARRGVDQGRVRDCETVARLLASATVLAILAALTFFVHQAREAANRTHCRSNLHQIALALHNYHDTYSCFPPAVTTDGQGRRLHRWTVYLLPFLDEAALYNAYNFARAWDAPANTTVGRLSLSQFACTWAGRPRPALTHYGMVVCPGSGIGMDRTCAIKDIKDGTSQTIAIMEMSRTACLWTEPAAIVDLTRGINAPRGHAQGASSEHKGGVFAAFFDGAVRFLSEETDVTTLRSLATSAGNEVIDDEDY
jgi:uncharacterized protein DUF1559